VRLAIRLSTNVWPDAPLAASSWKATVVSSRTTVAVAAGRSSQGSE